MFEIPIKIKYSNYRKGKTSLEFPTNVSNGFKNGYQGNRMLSALSSARFMRRSLILYFTFNSIISGCLLPFSRVTSSYYSSFLRTCNQNDEVTNFIDLGVIMDTKLDFRNRIKFCFNILEAVFAFIKRWAKDFDNL